MNFWIPVIFQSCLLATSSQSVRGWHSWLMLPLTSSNSVWKHRPTYQGYNFLHFPPHLSITGPLPQYADSFFTQLRADVTDVCHLQCLSELLRCLFFLHTCFADLIMNGNSKGGWKVLIYSYLISDTYTMYTQYWKQLTISPIHRYKHTSISLLFEKLPNI